MDLSLFCILGCCAPQLPLVPAPQTLSIGDLPGDHGSSPGSADIKVSNLGPQKAHPLISQVEPGVTLSVCSIMENLLVLQGMGMAGRVRGSPWVGG